ncbi:MAG: hypothetical protein RIE84_11320 [Parvibaculum sp.]|uniref:hypothetical protein n=1 Tax=Parvibaculum sp. TaxID=2024848 RepID=UPI0032ED1FB0
MNTANESTAASANSGRRPDWVVKAPRTRGKSPGLIRIGVAWDREDGGICLRLTGNQLVTGDLYIYPAAEGGAQ